MGAAGYFGYISYQQARADAQLSEQALQTAKASNLDLSAKIATLTQQVSALQTQLAEGEVKAGSPASTVPAVATTTQAAVALPSSITTIYGRTYTNCVLSRMTPDGISFTHSMGVAKVLFSDLDPALAAKFGYDAAAAQKYEQDEAAREAQSDALRSQAENANKPSSGAVGAADLASTAAASNPPDPGVRAAKQAQIAALENQITSLQSEAQRLEAQDVANFNSFYNIYYNSVGQVEHHSTMGHSQQAVQDRNEIVALQGQILALQNDP
jgi:hypothetical protein